MALTPTVPADPAQRIDSVYANGQLIEELVWTYPFDGTGVLRRDGQADQPVTGLPVPAPPEPTAEEKLAAAAAILNEAGGLAGSKINAEVRDILLRAAEALNGGS